MSSEEDCRLAVEQHAERLSELPNVQGVGVGEPLAGGAPDAGFSVKVYVSKKVPPEDLKESDLIPSKLGVMDKSGTAREVPVEVVEIGELGF